MTTTQTFYAIRRTDGRYLGSMCWTFNTERAIHFATKWEAEKTLKKSGYKKLEIVKIEN